MNSAYILAGISLFLFILKMLMIWSKTNLPANFVWQGISFLNSCIPYPWFLWGGYQIALYEQRRKIESASVLNNKHDLEIQIEKSRRYKVEKELKEIKCHLREVETKHRSEISSLKSETQKKSRSASDANDAALRSLL